MAVFRVSEDFFSCYQLDTDIKVLFNEYEHTYLCLFPQS